MYGLAVIPQNAAAGQIYAPMRRFVPITSANFADCNSLSISTPIRYAFQPFPPHLPRHHANLMLHKTGCPIHAVSSHEWAIARMHDRPFTVLVAQSNPPQEIRHHRLRPSSVLQSVPSRAIRGRLHWSSLNPRDTVRTSMPHWKIILTYDGTSFNGWQIQPNLPTIQGTLAQAIHRVTGESVLPQGSGRTDAGVHALGQVASFSLAVPIPAAQSPPRPQSSPPSQHPRPLDRARSPKTSTPATAPGKRPTSTASPPQTSVPPCLRPTYGTAISPSTSQPSKTPPTTSEAPTTSPPSPPPTQT